MEKLSSPRNEDPQEDIKIAAESNTNDTMADATATVEAVNPEGGIDSESTSSGVLTNSHASITITITPTEDRQEIGDVVTDTTSVKTTERIANNIQPGAIDSDGRSTISPDASEIVVEIQQRGKADTAPDTAPDSSQLDQTTKEIPNNIQPGDIDSESRSAISPDAPKIELQPTTKTETVTNSSLSDQDLAVYGEINKHLADALTERIEAAISDGVDSLPLLDGDCYRDKSSSTSEETSKPPKQRLWEALRYRFVRNIDVLEAYCAHHILTLRKHPPARRKRIVTILKDGVHALPALALEDKKEADEGKSRSRSYPTRSELPSEEERNDLVEELSRLKVDLENDKQKRNKLVASLESINHAEQFVEDVVTTVKASVPTLEQDAIRSDVTEKVEKGHTVGLLTEETKRLQKKLDGIKRDRATNKDGDEDEEAFDFVQQDDPLYKVSSRFGSKRHKPLSLEEAYENDRRQLGLLRDSTNDNGNEDPSLSAFKSMLMVPSSSSSSPPPPRTPAN